MKFSVFSILILLFLSNEMFRDPLNGAWCDSLHFAGDDELTPCGEGNNFYSSAGIDSSFKCYLINIYLWMKALKKPR